VNDHTPDGQSRGEAPIKTMKQTHKLFAVAYNDAR
jgi:hypothetical protein